MKITQSHIQMQSQHTYQHEESRQESLRVWIGEERPRFQGDPPTTAAPQTEVERVSLSDTAKRRHLLQTTPLRPQDETAVIQNGEDPKLMAMRLILEALTGKKINLSTMDDTPPESGPAMTPPSSATPSQASPREGWGLEYDAQHTIAEHEEMQFKAEGEVHNEAGEKLTIAVNLSLNRDFVERTDIHIRAGDARLVDPLVINFADQPADLSSQKFAFDLDHDGISEQISFVMPGSGFLFLDRNHDGRATDGTELFGPENGSGFAELAAFDSDGNGWLDDNDPMFAKLQVWVKAFALSPQEVADNKSTPAGKVAPADSFISLKDLSIGAILLAHQETPFSINDDKNHKLGQVANSGLFLREGGSAGTIQEIKLAV